MAPCAFAGVLKAKPAVGRLSQIMETGMALKAELPPFPPDQ
jgi:hypothetical protein